MTFDYSKLAERLAALGIEDAPDETEEERLAARAQLEIDRMARHHAAQRAIAEQNVAKLKVLHERQALHATGLPYTDDNGDIVVPRGDAS